MMFKRRPTQPSGAMDLSETELGDAREIMRVFLPAEEQGSIAGIFIDPPETLEPFGFGILLADLVHHGAKAYAYKLGLDEAQALYTITQGLSAELAAPTDTVEQIIPEANG